MIYNGEHSFLSTKFKLKSRRTVRTSQHGSHRQSRHEIAVIAPETGRLNVTLFELFPSWVTEQGTLSFFIEVRASV